MQELQALLTGENREMVAGAITDLLSVNKEVLPEDRSGWEHRIRQVTETDRAVPVAGSRATVVFFRRWWAAAAIVLVLGIGASLWMNAGRQASNSAAQQGKPILPGSQGAILTLADGSVVSLDTI